MFSGDYLWLAVFFYCLAILTAAVGARGIGGIHMDIAKWFVVIYVVLAMVSLVL